MTSLRDVLGAARTGASVRRIGEQLAIAPDLAELMLDHAERLGLAERARGGARAGSHPGPCAGCPTGAPATAEPTGSRSPLPLGCAGCFFARR